MLSNNPCLHVFTAGWSDKACSRQGRASMVMGVEFRPDQVLPTRIQPLFSGQLLLSTGQWGMLLSILPGGHRLPIRGTRSTILSALLIMWVYYATFLSVWPSAVLQLYIHVPWFHPPINRINQCIPVLLRHVVLNVHSWFEVPGSILTFCACYEL